MDKTRALHPNCPSNFCEIPANTVSGCTSDVSCVSSQPVDRTFRSLFRSFRSRRLGHFRTTDDCQPIFARRTITTHQGRTRKNANKGWVSAEVLGVPFILSNSALQKRIKRDLSRRKLNRTSLRSQIHDQIWLEKFVSMFARCHVAPVKSLGEVIMP